MVLLFRLFLFLCCTVPLLVPAASFAQDQEQKSAAARDDYTSMPYYTAMARDALENRPDNFDFGLFRRLYSQIEDYDPAGQVACNQIVNLSYYIQHEQDQAKRQKMLDDYASLLSLHLANIDVINQALALSYQDNHFGDPGFFEWMRGGLMASVKSSGDGSSLYNAYAVVTMAEDNALMNTMDISIIKTTTEESAGTYYTMHDVKDNKTGAIRTVFVDVTIPMRRLEQARREYQAPVLVWR